MPRHAPRPGRVRGRDGGDRLGQLGARVHHDERVAARVQRLQVVRRARRQDEHGTRDPVLLGQREQRRGVVLRALAREYERTAAVQRQGLDDGRDDRAEVVGQRVRAVHEHGRRAAPRAREAAPEPLRRLAHRPLCPLRDPRAPVDHARDRRDRHARLVRDGPERHAPTRPPAHAPPPFVRPTFRQGEARRQGGTARDLVGGPGIPPTPLGLRPRRRARRAPRALAGGTCPFARHRLPRDGEGCHAGARRGSLPRLRPPPSPSARRGASGGSPPPGPPRWKGACS